MIHQKYAVITGATSGLGRDLAVTLAEKGWKIMISGRNAREAEITLAMVKQAGGSGDVYLCDVTDADGVQKMANHVYSLWGNVDLVINNAGVAAAGDVGDMALDDWRWVVDVNLWGVVHGCHAFVPFMKKNGGGHIVNIASAAGFVSLPEMACYSATKAAVIALSESLRAELAPYNIGVSVVCPSFFKTNLLKVARSAEGFMLSCANTAFEHTRLTSEKIAYLTIRNVEKNRLYIVPHLSTRILWFFKRMSPVNYSRFFSMLKKRNLYRKMVLFLARHGFA